jgi:hypothetical protein
MTVIPETCRVNYESTWWRLFQKCDVLTMSVYDDGFSKNVSCLTVSVHDDGYSRNVTYSQHDTVLE